MRTGTVLVWIVADDYPWTEKKEQDLLTDPTVLADPARILEVTENVKALLDFKAWLRTKFGCETFTTADDLGRKISVGLCTRLKDKPVAEAKQVPTGEVRIVHALQPAPVSKIESLHYGMTFVRNHAKAIVASDLFVVVTETFQFVYVFVIIEVATRLVFHFNVTRHPSAVWALQQFRECITGDEG